MASGRLLRAFQGQRSEVASVAFDPDGGILASGSVNGTVNLWDTAGGKLLCTFPGQGSRIADVVFDPKGRVLASGADNGTVSLWDTAAAKLVRTFPGKRNNTPILAFESTGRILASTSADGTVNLWDTTTGDLLRILAGHNSPVTSVAFEPAGHMLATGSLDNTVKLWDAGSGKLRRTLEGHRGSVIALSFHHFSPLFATASLDDTIRIWNSETWDVVAVLQSHARYRFRGLCFHPSLSRLVTAGAHLYLYELDLNLLLGAERSFPTQRAVHYVNAKVVLLGDTGVGKTGLGLVLSGRPFAATDSTAGRHVWTLGMSEEELPGERKRTRETLLWDLAGQPGYRVIHQLHLSEVAVALVVFGARSETDPLAGVVITGSAHCGSRISAREMRLFRLRKSSFRRAPTAAVCRSAKSDSTP
jgi:hypothetical protein